MFDTKEERGRRQKLLARIIEFLKIPKVVLDKLKRRKMFQSSRIFGSTIPAITQVGTVVTKLSLIISDSRQRGQKYQLF